LSFWNASRDIFGGYSVRWLDIDFVTLKRSRGPLAARCGTIPRIDPRGRRNQVGTPTRLALSTHAGSSPVTHSNHKRDDAMSTTRNLVGMTFVLSLCFTGLMMIPASGADDHSANYYLPSCRDYVNRRSVNPFKQFQQGECVGIIYAQSAYANSLPFQTAQSCVPDNATIGQMATVVVRWLDERPQRWNEDFRNLVLYALGKKHPKLPRFSRLFKGRAGDPKIPSCILLEQIPFDFTHSPHA